MIPYVKWYPSDWLASRAFRVLTFEQQGIFFALLNIAWQQSCRSESPPFLPTDAESLADELAMDQQEFDRHWKVIGKFFQNGQGGLWNKRQMNEWEKAKDIIGKKRKAGKMGGKGRPGKQHPLAGAKQVLTDVSYPDPDSDTRNSNATSDELLSKKLPGKKVFRKSI